MDKRYQWIIALEIGPKLRRKLKTLADNGVDSDALKAIHDLSRSLQEINKVNNAMGLGAAAILIGQVGSGGSGGGTPDGLAKLPFSSGLRVFAKLGTMQDIAGKADIELKSEQEILSRRYKVRFSHIVILPSQYMMTWPMTIRVPAGACRVGFGS